MRNRQKTNGNENTVKESTEDGQVYEHVEEMIEDGQKYEHVEEMTEDGQKYEHNKFSRSDVGLSMRPSP